jgi:hypothetical protein
MPRESPPRSPVRGRRRLAAGALVAGVLALHGSGLGWLAAGRAPDPRVAPPAMQVRQVVGSPAPRRLAPPPPMPARIQRGMAPRLPPPQARPAPAQVPELVAVAVPEPAPAPAPEVPTQGWVAAATAGPMQAGMAGEPSASAAAARATPTYPTRVAPPFEARYRMQRGALSGDASLRWAHDGKGYQLRLEARVVLLGTVLTQQSTGGFDAAGLAPQRFVERRLRRGERAVNFVRPADGTPAHVSFSARTGEAPGSAGMQDRLSWVVQLGAIAAARPGGPHLGETIELDVAGPAGEVQHWVFSVAEAPAAGAAVKFVREPGAAYDTAVQVWLDPTHHYQLRRLRLAEARGDALELIRVEAEGSP